MQWKTRKKIEQDATEETIHKTVLAKAVIGRNPDSLKDSP